MPRQAVQNRRQPAEDSNRGNKAKPDAKKKTEAGKANAESSPQSTQTHGAVEHYEPLTSMRFDPKLPRELVSSLCNVAPDHPANTELMHLHPQPAKVGVQKIADPTHPAYGQSGLFARQALAPGAFVVPYLGYATLTPSQTSDYVLSFHLGLSVDAERMGSLARFVNDFRGVAERPNSEFRTFYDTSTRAVLIGVFVLKRKIKKGEEICVTYGKGYWQGRGVIEPSVS